MRASISVLPVGSVNGIFASPAESDFADPALVELTTSSMVAPIGARRTISVWAAARPLPAVRSNAAATANGRKGMGIQ